MSGIPSPLNDTFKAIAGKGEVYNKEDSPTDRYYAFLTEVEDIFDSKGGKKLWSAEFEMVPFEWMESAILSQSEATRSPPPPGPVTFLVFDDAPPEEVAKALATPVEEVLEGDWYIITLGKGGLAAKRVGTARGSPVQSLKAKGTKVDRRRTQKLNKRFKPLGKFSTAKVIKLLAALLPREIGVMDVGQGSCNLIYNDQGVPQLYVDLGLPLFFNWGSVPPVNALGNVEILTPGPCLHNNPPVILTHYHWDHYAMASWSANSAALVNRDWIFPNQVAPPAAWPTLLNIAAAANGHAHVFPALLAGIVGNYVNIIQCVPGPGIAAGNLNNSGLAVVVRIDDPPAATRALLTGDAAFQSIPGVGAIAALRWMPATHHGSGTDLIPPAAPPVPAPQVANQGRIAYSYGIMGGGVHCYGHPSAAAVPIYQAAGWGVGGVGGGFVASTAETGPNSGVAGRGNILMCNNVIPPACGVANCPFHAFPKLLV
ncbi:MAG: hypothetical protein QOD09_758 [Bradyrhizobium sp.]|jgi:hypothetical protein|nr:hypothetical protein [Bradyrhizobium sp.]